MLLKTLTRAVREEDNHNSGIMMIVSEKRSVQNSQYKRDPYVLSYQDKSHFSHISLSGITVSGAIKNSMDV